jgi:hypothetical protein
VFLLGPVRGVVSKISGILESANTSLTNFNSYPSGCHERTLEEKTLNQGEQGNVFVVV